jgi:hypothetical protein
VVVVSPRPGTWLEHEMETLRRRGIEVVHVSPLEVDPKYVPELRLAGSRGA